MLAELPPSVHRDARIMVEEAAMVEGNLAEMNERRAAECLRRVIFRARMLEKWLPKEGENDGASK